MGTVERVSWLYLASGNVWNKSYLFRERDGYYRIITYKWSRFRNSICYLIISKTYESGASLWHFTFFSADEEGEGRSERPSRLPAPAFKMPQPFRAHAHQSADRSGREEPKRSRSLVLRPHHQPDSTPSNSETHQRRKTITKIPGPKKNLRLKNSLFIYASYSSLCKRVLKSSRNTWLFVLLFTGTGMQCCGSRLFLRKESHKVRSQKTKRSEEISLIRNSRSLIAFFQFLLLCSSFIEHEKRSFFYRYRTHALS